MKEFWKSEGLGILFTAALGSFGHFAYDLSKENILVALFCPVNESTWEHLKLLFFPFLLFSLLRLFFSEKKSPVFATSLFLGVAACLLFISESFFFSFSGSIFFLFMFGFHSLPTDIAIFLLSVVFSFAVCYLVQFRKAPGFNGLSILFLLILTGLFFIFTFAPPDTPLFQNPVTKGYGIQAL